MKDRVPTKPNRYAVYDDSHNFLRYEYHERADEPTTVGTPLNKANLLADAVKALLWPSGSVPTDPSINDVFSRLSAGLLYDNGAVKNMLGQLVTLPVSQLDNPVHIATGSYTGTGTYGAANPCTLTFPFVPKMLVVSGGMIMILAYPYGFSIRGNAYSSSSGSYNLYADTPNVSVSGNTLSWYDEISAEFQHNSQDTTYRYICFG